MRHVWSFVVAASVALGAAIALAPSTASADAAACGGKTNPCPLQKWMQDNIGSKMADGNLKDVATGLDKAASLSPDAAWGEWATIAKAGADAARKGDMPGTKAACKNCHDKFKQQYKDKYRTRTVP
jgi:hypothetical protein